jgi:hypothetical protein
MCLLSAGFSFSLLAKLLIYSLAYHQKSKPRFRLVKRQASLKLALNIDGVLRGSIPRGCNRYIGIQECGRAQVVSSVDSVPRCLVLLNFEALLASAQNHKWLDPYARTRMGHSRV